MAFDPVRRQCGGRAAAADGRPAQGLKAQGATSVDVVITNTDLVDDAELLELVELEIRDLAEQNGLAVGSITRDPSGASGPSGIYGPPS